ncbi:hypothetical protein [Bradyrhizobium sp. JYMT SZCCT0428]|uniref:hypothetical protein n=1 Tax=Bradyrhizobium sp. JYMT SZCCT0428 TaxID=2807673 RepID=UPI001BA7A825|nr:hypothetical protein [Bradyrhizobium sp. JYMT SZCCT0428]MBR1154809.1 hypothetical protein [Bradyrhizobium sp. JYMT SZCCT0428]
MAPDPLVMLKFATSVVGGLKHIRPKTESRDVRIQNNVSYVLREIYFAPSGILSLLNEIAEGEHPAEVRLRQALADFNDKQWKIEGALQSVEYDALKDELGLSLNALRALHMLREGKSELRWTVQQEVNFYGQDGVWPSKTRVRRLIKAIHDLNTEIERIEAIINRRGSAAPHPQPPSKKQKQYKKRRLSPAKSQKG